MKKVLLILLILFISTSCDIFNKNEETNDTIEETQEQTNLINSFDLELTNNNIEYEKNEVNNSIGATKSYIYLLGDNSFTLYIFDTSSSEYRLIEETGYITIGSSAVEQPVIINDELVIYFNSSFTEKTEIESIFFNL